ncbi:hypothetical protein [Pseudomonas sp. 2FE]|uniref:hypothetical protein n=1 Tax=Pseudomonas sp. 2FE TaxID=2502190 RepID=UPI0010F87135|nr:hypothetical protein [Pseudomonas sp. 2FE]
MLRSSRSLQMAIVFATGVAILSLLRYLLGAPGAFIFAVILGLFGILIFVASLFIIIKSRSRASTLAALITCTAWIVWLLAPLDLLGVYAKFWLERPQYELAVAEVVAGKQPDCVTSKFCQYESGSPVPLAFPWEGIIDNWIGIVYDPSGDVQDAERFKNIFGGDLLECNHLSGPFFLCSFT